jgi:hypothetical protein
MATVALDKRNSEEVVAGALPQAALEQLISQVREIDMDEVRRQLAEEAGESVTARP